MEEQRTHTLGAMAAETDEVMGKFEVAAVEQVPIRIRYRHQRGSNPEEPPYFAAPLKNFSQI